MKGALDVRNAIAGAAILIALTSCDLTGPGHLDTLALASINGMSLPFVRFRSVATNGDVVELRYVSGSFVAYASGTAVLTLVDEPSLNGGPHPTMTVLTVRIPFVLVPDALPTSKGYIVKFSANRDTAFVSNDWDFNRERFLFVRRK